MAKGLDNASRTGGYSANPDHLILVWPGPTRNPNMGPNDILLTDYPDNGDVRACFDPSGLILTEERIQSMMVKLGNAYVGVLQNVVVRVIPWKDSKGADIDGLFIVAGRGRTLDAREANKRLQSAGVPAGNCIRVPFDTRKLDSAGVEFVKTIENIQRREITILDMAWYARQQLDIKQPQDVIMKALGKTSWAAVENYLAVLDLDPSLQVLVNDRTIPLSETVKIGKTVKGVEAQRALAQKFAAAATPAPQGESGKAKVKASEVKRLTGEASGKPETGSADPIPGRKRLQAMAATLAGALANRENAAPTAFQWQQGAADMLAFILDPKSAPEWIRSLMTPPAQTTVKGKAKKPAAVETPESRAAADKARAIQDGIIRLRTPVRYALMMSLRKWEESGVSDMPDESCKDHSWYARIHGLWTSAYNKLVSDTPADKELPTREDFFAKWIEKLSE